MYLQMLILSQINFNFSLFSGSMLKRKHTKVNFWSGYLFSRAQKIKVKGGTKIVIQIKHHKNRKKDWLNIFKFKLQRWATIFMLPWSSKYGYVQDVLRGKTEQSIFFLSTDNIWNPKKAYCWFIIPSENLKEYLSEEMYEIWKCILFNSDWNYFIFF